MPNPNQEFAEYSILRTINLQAVATWMIRELIQQLKQLESEVAAKVIFYNPGGARTPATRKDRLKNLLSDIEDLIKEAYAEIESRMGEMFEDMADVINDQDKQNIFAIFGFKPSSQTKLAGITGALIMGITYSEWLNSQADDLNFRYSTAIKKGMDQGETGIDLGKRVTGEKPKPEAPAIAIHRPAETAERNLEVLTRTGVESVGNEVTQRIAEKIPDTIRVGWQQISVLDSRTTEICRAYAFKIWDKDFKPIGHDLDFDGGCPRHWNCRSNISMVVLDEDQTSEFTFKDWLNTISPVDLDRIFGKRQMELYRAGKVTDAGLIRQQQRALSPDDLRKEPDPRLQKE